MGRPSANEVSALPSGDIDGVTTATLLIVRYSVQKQVREDFRRSAESVSTYQSSSASARKR